MLITVIKPSFEILTNLTKDSLKFLELAGRVCYKSEDRITEQSSEKFIKMLRDSHHESVLEHVSASVRIIGSRSMSHQLVRHRLNSYSQESQRFCNYGKKGFQVICPDSIGIEPGEYYFAPNQPFTFYRDEELKNQYQSGSMLQYSWLGMRGTEYLEYLYYLTKGLKPEDARECLPNATKTELIMTCNLRQWRHVFSERALNKHAQNQIRFLMAGVLKSFAKSIPVVFDDQISQLAIA